MIAMLHKFLLLLLTCSTFCSSLAALVAVKEQRNILTLMSLERRRWRVKNLAQTWLNS